MSIRNLLSHGARSDDGQADPVAAALEELGKAREMVRERSFEFSTATLHKWNELEAEIENKLEGLETRLPDANESAGDVALARINELSRALHDLVENHLHCPTNALMCTAVRVCSPHDSLEQVAHQLWDADCGALPVVDDSGRVLGMITDRDACMATYLQGCAPAAARVSSAMSKEVYTCSPDESLQRVCELMSEHQVRRIPVVTAGQHLIGIISVADIVRHLNGLPVDHPARQLLVTTLAAICDRRQPARSTVPVSWMPRAAE